MKKIIALVVALLFVLVVGCGSKSTSGDPQKVVKAYFDDLKAKNYDKAYTYWKTDKSKADWIKAKKDYGMTYDKYEVKKAKITGNNATVEVVIEGFPLPYQLVKVNNAWKITGYAMGGANAGTSTTPGATTPGTTTPGTNPHANGSVPTTPTTPSK